MASGNHWIPTLCLTPPMYPKSCRMDPAPAHTSFLVAVPSGLDMRAIEWLGSFLRYSLPSGGRFQETPWRPEKAVPPSRFTGCGTGDAGCILLFPARTLSDFCYIRRCPKEVRVLL